MMTVVGTLVTQVALVPGTDWISCISKEPKATIIHGKSVGIPKSCVGSSEQQEIWNRRSARHTWRCTRKHLTHPSWWSLPQAPQALFWDDGGSRSWDSRCWYNQLCCLDPTRQVVELPLCKRSSQSQPGSEGKERSKLKFKGCSMYKAGRVYAVKMQ